MWKIQLTCFSCKQTTVEGVDAGMIGAVRGCKQAARNGGWVFVRNKGWLCSHCRNPVTIEIGERVRYIGTITSPEMVGLKGHVAQVVEERVEVGVIHVIFEDPAVGRYAQHAHWFFVSEFELVTEEVDASNKREVDNAGPGQDSPQVVERLQDNQPTNAE